MPLFPYFRALAQLLWISFANEPLWLFTCSAAPSPKQPNLRGVEGNQQMGYSAEHHLNCVFLAGWFNIHLGKLKLFSKYIILKLALYKLASFLCDFLPCSFNLVLEFPQHEFIVSFNISRLKSHCGKQGWSNFFSPICIFKHILSLPNNTAASLSILLLMLPLIFSWFSLTEYSSPLCFCVFLGVPYWLWVNQSNIMAKLKWDSPSF